MRRLIWAILLLAAGGLAGVAAEDFRAVLADIDRTGSFTDGDFSCLMTVVSEKPGQEPNIQQAQVFRRDAEEKAVILILRPEVQKGQGYLQIGESLWFYDPESRQFAHTALKENFQDSDAKHSDFRPPALARDYRVVSGTEGELGRYRVYVLELEASTEEVSYARLRLWVRRDNHLLLKAENYGLSGRLMRTSYYPSYLQLGEKYLATKMLFVDELRPGEKTQVTLANASLAPIADSVFTKAYVERVNR
ncbi:MAG: outer membrane lipoprotein-sorting protein [Spirochaetales bacterium]|nr:outer membrane lipoprotein-sorting protein [Spirochaetales bacterium]